VRTKRKHSGILSLLLISFICFVILLAMVAQIFFIDKASSGLNANKVNGIDVSGLSLKEANLNIVSHYKEKAEDFKLTLTHENNSWTLDNSDFKVNSNIHTILDEKQRLEKATSTHNKKVNYIKNSIKDGNSIDVSFNQIYVGLDEKINNIIKEVEKEAKNSEVKFNPNGENMFEIIPSETGLKVDKELLYKEINKRFLKNEKLNIELPTYIVEPEIKEEDTSKLTNKIAEFSTDVSDSTGGRKSNVKLALSKFNGMVVAPGEEVSFNTITAPHTLENGYKIATIIVNGRFVDGVGGGICQASTTLYNTLLQTGIEISEVNKHTLPVRYVPLALDAMVSVGISDLKFKNTTNYPLFFKTSADENSVKVEIFSHELEDNISYKTRSETIKELPALGDIIQKDENHEYSDKVLFEGEYYRLSYPRGGYEAKAYLQTYKNGELISEKLIRHEIYKPQHGLIIEGAEKAPENISPIEDKVEPQTAESYSHGIIINEQNYTIPTNICPWFYQKLWITLKKSTQMTLF